MFDPEANKAIALRLAARICNKEAKPMVANWHGASQAKLLAHVFFNAGLMYRF